MKVVCTTVRPDQVGRVVDMLRTLGHADVRLDQDDAAVAVRLEVLVKQVDATGAAIALARATSQDPHPVLVTDASSLTAVGESAGG